MFYVLFLLLFCKFGCIIWFAMQVVGDPVKFFSHLAKNVYMTRSATVPLIYIINIHGKYFPRTSGPGVNVY